MSPNPSKKKVEKKLYIESIIIFLIALTPFYLKIYDYFPGPNSEAAHNPISFLGIQIGSNGFDSISTNLWFYFHKIVPLALFILWFFTSKNWWYHIIIIPIATYAFQLFELIYSEDDIIDSENIWWLLPVCMVVIPFVYFIRIKLYDKYVHGIDLEAIEAEIEVLNEKQEVDKKEPKPSSSVTPKEVGYKSLSEKIDEKLSTGNIEYHLRQFQNQLGDWLHLRF